MLPKNFSALFYCLFLLIGLSMATKAQDTERIIKRDSPKTDKEDSVTIEMDTELKAYLQMMDSLDAKNLKAYGYRIQIFSSSGPSAKRDALQSQADFLKLYSESSAYTKWDYPNWVVRLGDYRTHLEALEFHNEVKNLYPASFIVKDEISVQ